VGCCPRDKLCDRCLADALAHLRGVAACRGEFWASRVAARVTSRSHWPAYDEPRCRRIARAKVADLASDARLLDELARIAHAWASRRWNELGR